MQKLVVVAMTALLVPAASRAQAAADSRFQVGVRAGYQLSAGDAAKDAAMKDFSLRSQIPLQVEAAFKVTPELAVGPYFSWGFGMTDDAFLRDAVGSPTNICDEDFGDGTVDCTGSAWRLGAQAIYTLRQLQAPLVPWVGVNVGYHSAEAEAEDRVDRITVQLNGYEVGVQLGGDFRVSDRFAVGPFLSYSLGQFRTGETRSTFDPADNTDGDIEDKALHHWFGIGLRAAFDL